MDISNIGQQFGLNEAETRAALEALVPVVAAGVRRNAQTPDGLRQMYQSALTGKRARVFEEADALRYETARGSGDEILGRVFGSKEVSRGVAQQLSASSGIGAAILKKLLPIAASIVMGQVAKKMGAGTGGASGGGLGDILGDILGGALGGGQKQAPIPQGGSGGLEDILKDILGGGSQQQQKAPSQPRGQSSGNPLEDMLNDILGGGAKGGAGQGGGAAPVPPGDLGEILKDIFGGNLPGGTGMPQQRPTQDSVSRGRKTLDDVLGGGTRRGSDADILLDSVERSIRGG